MCQYAIMQKRTTTTTTTARHSVHVSQCHKNVSFSCLVFVWHSESFSVVKLYINCTPLHIGVFVFKSWIEEKSIFKTLISAITSNFGNWFIHNYNFSDCRSRDKYVFCMCADLPLLLHFVYRIGLDFSTPSTLHTTSFKASSIGYLHGLGWKRKSFGTLLIQ